MPALLPNDGRNASLRRNRHPYLVHEGPIPMVHRGAPTPGAESDADPLVENTAAAFERAYSMGFRYFETDVHATLDQVPVVCHDRTLRRVAGQRVRISDLTWDELSDIPVGDAPLPRLHALLTAYPDVRFNIDPKADTVVRPLARLLTELEVLDRVCLASFSDRRLRWLRVALGARACTAAGPRELAAASRRVTSGGPIDLPDVDVLQVPRLMARQRPGPGADLLDAAQRVGLPVHVWTVNDEPEMRQLLARGADGVMSDDPELLSRVFGEHGWRPAGD
jgi:glycerophosphoryl diester phosphodiesterase